MSKKVQATKPSTGTSSAGFSATCLMDMSSPLFLAGFCSLIADVSLTLAICPNILLFGPSIGDTAYSIALPISVLALVPLVSWFLTRNFQQIDWLLVAHISKLLPALFVIGSLGQPGLSSNSLVTCLAAIWGNRLFESSVMSQKIGDCKNRFLQLAGTCSMPAVFLCLLFLPANLQSQFVGLSIAAYLISLLSLTVSMLAQSRNATTGNADLTTGKARKNTNRFYETLVVVPAVLLLIVPLVLVLSMQAGDTTVHMKELIAILSGWFVGSFVFTLLSTGPGPRFIRMEHLHLLFILALSAFYFVRLPAMTPISLAIASAAAGALLVEANRKRDADFSFRFHLRITILSVTVAALVLHLLPLQSYSAFFHVLRSLALYCLIPLAVAAPLWRRSRMTAVRLAARLVPIPRLVTDGWAGNSQPAIYIARELGLSTALIVGTRLEAKILLLVKSENSSMARLANQVLSLVNLRMVSTETIQDLGNAFQMQEHNQVLLCSLSEDDDSKPVFDMFSSTSKVGILQKRQDENTIVISDMVRAPKQVCLQGTTS